MHNFYYPTGTPHACTEQCERGQCECPMAGECCTEIGADFASPWHRTPLTPGEAALLVAVVVGSALASATLLWWLVTCCLEALHIS